MVGEGGVAFVFELFFYDCFGNVHHFFRPYAHKTLECKVRILPFGYCYSDDEIVWTKSKRALLSHTSLRAHPLAPASKADSHLKRLITTLRNAKKWLKFYCSALFCKPRNAKIALLYRYVGDHYGHFIKETMAGYYQLQLANIEPDFYILPLNTTFQKQMYALLGIPEEKIIPTHSHTLICAKQLILPTLIADYEMVEYRKHAHSRSFILPPFIYTMYDPIIARLLKIAHTNPHSPLPKKIFLARPKDSNRNIINHAAVEKVFQDFGYEIVVSDTLSLEQQIILFASASAVASMHGAGLDNTIFAKEGTKVFEIFPKYYHDGAEQIIALARQCKYDYIVGETSDLSPHPQQENVYINPNKLAQALTKHLNPQRAR